MAEKQSTRQLAAQLDGLSAKVIRLQKEMEGLNKNSFKYKETQKQLNKTHKEAIAIQEKLRMKTASLTKNNKNHRNSIKTANESQKRFNATTKKTNGLLTAQGKGFGAVIKSLGRYLAASGAIAGTLALLREVFVNSAKRAIELEKALADVGAVAGLSNDSLAKLENTALKVAGATSLTAVEVVALQKELAKLGVSADDIVNLTRPVALLSQALGESGDAVAQTLQKIQNQFGLTSEEANKTANELVGAVNNSALTMNDLATGLQYVGPLAKQAGLSFSETASFLGVLADNGFRASRAGTGFRAILSEAAKAGVPFNEFMDNLAENGISAADAIELFTKRGAAAAITITQQYDEVKKLNEELAESDRLLYANAKQMGSTQGQIDLLKSAYDRASVSLGQWITNTEFFLELIERLDPNVAGQARAYKFLSNATEESRDNFDKLTESLVSYNKEQGVDGLGAQLQILKANNGFTNDQLELLKAQFTLEKMKNEQLTLSQFLQSKSKEEYKDAGLFLEGIVELGAERANQISEERLVEAAKNETYKEAVAIQEELNSLALKGKLTDEEKEKALTLINQRISESTALFASATDVDSSKLYEKRIDLYERLRETIENTANTELDANKNSQKKARFDLENYKIRRDERLQELADLRAFDLEAAKTSEERNQIEIKYAEDVARVNKEAAEALGKINAALYSNQVSIENTVDKWNQLGEVTGEQSVKIFQGFVDNFEKDIKKTLDESADALDNGEISVDEYNERIADAVEYNKLVVESGLEALVEAGKLTQEEADKLGQAINNLEVDTNTMFAPEETLLGRFFGIDTQEYISESAKKSGEDYAEAVNEQAKKFAQEYVKSAINGAERALDEFNETALENTKNRLDQELDAIKARYETEEDILKSQLDNQLITESQFRAKQRDLRRAQIAEENSVNRQIFEAEKRQEKNDAIIDTAAGVAEAFARELINKGFPAGLVSGAILSSAVAASGAARVAAINQRQFFPKKFADGGMVSGPSHAEGGVPFTVQGQGGYEMEGGEYIINKRAASMHKDLLDKINSSGKTAPVVGTRTFAQGGQVINSQSDQSVEYLKAIAEFTGVAANNSNKPVRAYVSDKDLRDNDRERTIRERNDRV